LSEDQLIDEAVKASSSWCSRFYPFRGRSSGDKAGATTQCGVCIDLSKAKVPLYLLASREDHIVPWQSAYRSKGLTGKNPRFVLAASGHVAGVINPPARKKRSYWTHDDLSGDAADWLEKAEEKPGSWWPDWDT